MLRLLTAAWFLSVACVIVAEDVLTLTQANFDSTVEANEFVVVEFYAPWCGHCKKLAPEYEKAAGVLKSLTPPIVLAKVDATEEKELAARFKVKGYPSLQIFRGKDEQPIDYSGPRDSEGIISYLKKRAGPASQTITSTEELNALLDSAEVAIVALLGSDGSADEAATTYATIAAKLRDELSFAQTVDKALLNNEYEVPTVVVYRKFDTPKVIYEGDFSVASLEAFIVTHSLPQVTELDQKPENREKLRKLFGSPLPKVMMFADYTKEGIEQLKVAFAEAAAHYSGTLVFVQGDSINNEGAMKFFGFTTETLPVVVIHDTETDMKYSLTDADPDKIHEWLKAFTAGEVESIVKSEEIPEANEGPVKVVVGNSFDKEIMQATGNVIIEFYAPWCGHCKKLAPIFEALAEDFKDNSEITFAKQDATANDIPPPHNKRFVVKGFPTIYFKTKTDEITLYTGGRTYAELHEYVELKLQTMKDEESAPEML